MLLKYLFSLFWWWAIGRCEGVVRTLRAVRFDWCARWVVGCPRSEVKRLEPFGIDYRGVRIGEKWSLDRDSVSRCHVTVILSY